MNKKQLFCGCIGGSVVGGANNCGEGQGALAGGGFKRDYVDLTFKLYFNVESIETNIYKLLTGLRLAAHHLAYIYIKMYVNLSKEDIFYSIFITVNRPVY